MSLSPVRVIFFGRTGIKSDLVCVFSENASFSRGAAYEELEGVTEVWPDRSVRGSPGIFRQVHEIAAGL